MLLDMPPKSIEIIEVGPRDGLQIEPDVMPTEVKVEFIKRLLEAGLRKIEVTSFVHPGKVPQMADAEQVVSALPLREDVTYIGLALNDRGFERAAAAGIDEVGFAVVASDTFNRRNQGASTEESIAVWKRIASAADSAGIRANVMISASFGCPFEGAVPESRVIDIAKELMKSDPIEIALADTIGVATPWQVRSLIGQLRPVIGATPLRCHFHNTRNTGIANAFAAIESGASALDASTGGIGGCPFAPAATGNIATEDLAYMLRHSGIDTGVSMPKLLETADWLGLQMNRAVPSMLSRAGDFSPDALASSVEAS
jgi:hydroxymethylglutaryl-CoA lyase